MAKANARDLVGAWTLERYELVRPDGRIVYPMGEDALGLLIYTAEPGSPSAERHSTIMVFPAIYPKSLSPRRNAPVRFVMSEGGGITKCPILGICFGCCASAENAVNKKTVSTR